MLKFIFMLIFMIPLCLFKNFWWLIHSFFFLMGFMFMFMINYCLGWMHLSYFFGCDIISFGLIFLSFWISVLMIMASEIVFRFNYYSCFFTFMVIFLMLMLFCTFSSVNLFMFYLFFESSLIPTLFLIIGWGYQPERLQAGVYLLFYTLLASLPLLIGIFFYYDFGGLLVFFCFSESYIYGWMFYLCMIFAFLVKMPMFIVHLWLPSAHVEAPVSGSMILAGVLLKLGGYGLMRVFSLLIFLGVNFNYIWLSIGLVGGVLVSLICMRQTDLKSLVAYSSIAHMGMVIGGLMTMSYWGFVGSYVFMIAHGLCSSGLFCLVNITYERLGSRSILVNSGLISYMPSMTFWWFLLSSSNMAAPPSLNLLGEINLLNCLVSWSWLSMFFLVFLSFFCAVYTLYMYSYSQHGMIYSGVYSCSLGYIREYLLLFLHWVPLNLVILSVDIILV
uniref:NADH-ubiquinone oxidoreductase chain 4 n=1 Tax=Polyphaga plancyi TaxID=1804147 RepID=A0A6M9AW87_9NEOP|nr:NADH dehydrogenase subunit 4 [Polyphaga plancyi]QKK69172.1 NADH dehydrogenase subunit 4 [Polyphaga plancyi]WGO57842.1 NADH dehydrogenase subunit 4 [Polyphaga plancyi]